MASRQKTWREKFNVDRRPELVDSPRGRMLIATPPVVDAVVRRIGEGKLVTVKQIQEYLAEEYDADLTCPLTTGIFLRIVSEVAEDDLSEGKEEVTPYWRVLKANGTLNPKYPGGTDSQKVRLEQEGHIIESGKGNQPPRVRAFLEALQRL